MNRPTNLKTRAIELQKRIESCTTPAQFAAIALTWAFDLCALVVDIAAAADSENREHTRATKKKTKKVKR